jgi:ABC-2 type transport system permease protein
MSHIFAIAGREVRSLFSSPVAYVVLTLWAVLAGTFFLSSLYTFQERLALSQQYGQIEQMAAMNLNDSLIAPFIGSMWVVMIFLLPAITMGLFASERANGTEELLLTSPLSIWQIVLGKFLGASLFASLMTLICAFFPAILFAYGEPEVGKTFTGLLGLLLVSLAYVAVGAFASALTRNQLIAFIISLVLLLVLGLMLPFLVDVALGGATTGAAQAVAGVMRYIATGFHFERLLEGMIDTADLAYFCVAIGSFLLLTKTTVESARWR